MAASLCLRHVAFPELFRKNATAGVLLRKSEEVTDKECALVRDLAPNQRPYGLELSAVSDQLL
jgi:hypothetical protein